MNVAHQARRIDELLGARRSLARVTNVVGAVAPAVSAVPAVADSPMKKFMREVNEARLRDVPDGVGTIAGAVAGYYLYRKQHPVLGVIGGASLGRNVPELLDPANRGVAMRNLVTTGAGIAASLHMTKHPVLGFIGGALLGGIASHFAGLR